MPNMQFKQHETGLHYYDPNEDKDGEVLVNTVAENLQGYSKKQIAGAQIARITHQGLCFPSTQQCKWAVQNHMIKDCPITVQDIDNALAIYGKDPAGLKGKTTRTKPTPVAGHRLKIPKGIMDKHKNVFMSVDTFFVNQIPFFLSLSRKINYTGVQNLSNRKVRTAFAAFVAIYSFYRRRNFIITEVSMDGEFVAL